MLSYCLFLIILKIYFYNPSQIATRNMDHGSHSFIIWIAINCYQVLFGKYFMYYWNYIFTWKKHQYYIDCCSSHFFKSVQSSNQEVLCKIGFLNNPGKCLEKKAMAQSIYSKADILQFHKILHHGCFCGSFHEIFRTVNQ